MLSRASWPRSAASSLESTGLVETRCALDDARVHGETPAHSPYFRVSAGLPDELARSIWTQGMAFPLS